ncbi:MAG: ATP-binding cassette domain-containing protein [Pseudomonadales bacterium]|jgi:iron complex transport system ATP-binding protein|tara:strand:- start:3246 stop:4049 length:804 start_codon:yes stop_codon:yes gene_type:complete
MLALDQVGWEVNGRSILNGLCFELELGQHLAIMGPNGAGKSTLLSLITGDVAATAGSLQVFGKPPSAFSPIERAQRISALSQASELRFPFTVEEVIGLGRYPFQARVESTLAIVAEVMAALQLNAFAQRSMLTLSGGERQRVHLARAVAQIWSSQEPVLLLLDEPFAALDIAHQVGVRQLLAKILASHPVSIVSVVHDLGQTTQGYDRVCLLNAQGQQLAFGAPSTVLTPARLSELYGIAISEILYADGAPAGFGVAPVSPSGGLNR